MAGRSTKNGGNDSALSTFGIVAAISTLLLLGMTFGASLWVLAAVAAGLLVATNYYLTRVWSTATIAKRVTGDRELKIGSLAPVEVTLTNHAKLPTIWLLAEDLMPRQLLGGKSPPLKIEGERLGVMMLWPGETKTLSYQVRCHRRGYIQIGPTVLETGDMMGLFRRFRVGTPPQFLTVMPEVVPLTAYEIGSRRPIGEIRMKANVMDDPTRLQGIRQWQIGDPMRRVHWAATARTGTLHSKIYEPSSIIGATIILDLHQSTNPAHNEPVRCDLAVTAAASIAGSLHDAGEPFGLATNGRDAADRIRTEGWVGDHRVRDLAAKASQMSSTNDRLRPVILPAARGPVQFKEVHRTLARLERTDGLTLSEMIIECEAQFSGETTLLFIVQTATEETLGALIGLSQRGRAVAVIINTHDINDYTAIAGPLIAARIPTFHLSASDAIADVCRNLLVRA